MSGVTTKPLTVWSKLPKLSLCSWCVEPMSCLITWLDPISKSKEWLVPNDPAGAVRLIAAPPNVAASWNVFVVAPTTK